MSGSIRIGIVGGAGWLGNAIARSLIRAGSVTEEDLILSFRSRQPDFHPKAHWTRDSQELADKSNVIILSVRPDDWHSLSIDVRGKLVISVMAGISAEAIAQRHNTRRVVRALPNAAAEIALSYTPWLASAQVTSLDRTIVRIIFDACGTQDEVTSERDIDYLTGLTGTGPAYPALLALAMLDDARSHGLSEDIALRAVNGLIIGAGGLLQARPEHPQKTLDAFFEYRGTTAAGLNAMKDRGFAAAVSDGLAAALEKTLVMGGQP
ncbi:pyrroline-5-carboxylate reductase (plasmid) [Rhizobium grahamii]|uniref:Pyrroline-5-carboxylate reductase n=1 Tax=Rhizobium grahamii TaxID=1120045 RepID=A0A5Q0CCB6_9HYPH|nr:MULTISPECIES: pyrroline-5-carboxylate reductase dimerization domain-containing protein [Rhizobium]QFY63062.1 pyrroline-5-carboxylate reductase [Rhizobium grahamii]QRM52176.1 pyrroline-5-carboxylate reductase [Rhizobium sp. BG6]